MQAWPCAARMPCHGPDSDGGRVAGDEAADLGHEHAHAYLHTIIMLIGSCVLLAGGKPSVTADSRRLCRQLSRQHATGKHHSSASVCGPCNLRPATHAQLQTASALQPEMLGNLCATSCLRAKAGMCLLPMTGSAPETGKHLGGLHGVHKRQHHWETADASWFPASLAHRAKQGGRLVQRCHGHGKQKLQRAWRMEEC